MLLQAPEDEIKKKKVETDEAPEKIAVKEAEA